MRSINSFRLSDACQVEVAVERRGHVAERLVLLTPIVEVSRRRGSPVISSESFPNHHQSIRFGIRQRTQYDGVQHTEDCSVSANAKGQGQHRNGCDDRVFKEETNGVLKVMFHGELGLWFLVFGFVRCVLVL
jgi:hypothetical protein